MIKMICLCSFIIACYLLIGAAILACFLADRYEYYEENKYFDISVRFFEAVTVAALVFIFIYCAL